MSGSSFALQLCVGLVEMLLPGLGQAGQLGSTMTKALQFLRMTLSLALFTQGLSSMTSTLMTGCVLKGACSENEAFILTTAITVAGSMAAGGALGAANGGAINNLATAAGKSLQAAGGIGAALVHVMNAIPVMF